MLFCSVQLQLSMSVVLQSDISFVRMRVPTKGSGTSHQIIMYCCMTLLWDLLDSIKLVGHESRQRGLFFHVCSDFAIYI